MSSGSVDEAANRHWLISLGLVGVIILCAILLGLAHLSRPWIVAVQVTTAVAGAALGSAIRLDTSRQTIHNQARPATRHLFDQVTRLRQMVVRAEGHQASIIDSASRDLVLDPHRTADWFGDFGAGLRSEINATATAIEDWGDLAPEVVGRELSNYRDRENRLPTNQEGPANNE